MAGGVPKGLSINTNGVIHKAEAVAQSISQGGRLGLHIYSGRTCSWANEVDLFASVSWQK